MSFHCQSCGAKIRIRGSQEVTRTIRTVYYECTNIECQEKSVGTHSIDRVVNVSLKKVNQMNLDNFIAAVPVEKRDEIIKILSSSPA